MVMSFTLADLNSFAGMHYPINVETALSVEQVVRDNGAIPATIAIVQGRIKIGKQIK